MSGPARNDPPASHWTPPSPGPSEPGLASPSAGLFAGAAAGAFVLALPVIVVIGQLRLGESGVALLIAAPFAWAVVCSVVGYAVLLRSRTGWQRFGAIPVAILGTALGLGAFVVVIEFLGANLFGLGR